MTRGTRLGAFLFAICLALGLGLGTATPSVAQVNGNGGHVDWEGWSLNYGNTGLREGVSITGVTYDGLEIISKASLPVMNVYYETWRRDDSVNGCGPYADRMGGSENEPITVQEFTVAGEKWLEIGMEDRIGAYGIYQVFYLSENGVIDAHIFSNGLQCSMFHEHLPFWRFDFDIAGSGNDQIMYLDGDSYQLATEEFELPASAATNHDWRVVDFATGDQVAVYFDSGDYGRAGGEVVPEDNYRENKLSVVAFDPDEVNWGTGPRDYNPYVGDRSILRTDLVLWYQGYMPHSPEEGSSLWHSTGIRIVVNPDDLGPVDPGQSPTPVPTARPTATPVRATPTATPTLTPQPTATPTPAATSTPAPTATSVPQPTATPTPAPLPAATTIINGSTRYDFESNTLAWLSNPRGNDTGSAGLWERGRPGLTTWSATGASVQPGNAAEGSYAMVTGPLAGRSLGANDVDNGVVSIITKDAVALPTGSLSFSVDWFFSHLSATNSDGMRVSLVGSNGRIVPVVEQFGSSSNREPQWTKTTGAYGNLGTNVRVLLEAWDGASGSIVEAGVDAIRITPEGARATATPVPAATATPVPPTALPTATPSAPTPTPGAKVTVYTEGFENGMSWSDTSEAEADPAERGRWSAGIVQATDFNGLRVQPSGGSASGRALATEPRAGRSVGANDVDGGVATAVSPGFALPNSSEIQLQFDRFFAHLDHSTADDMMSLSVRSGGTDTVVSEIFGSATHRAGDWQRITLRLDRWRGQNIQLVVRAADGGSGSIIEAGLDNVVVSAR